MVINYRVFGHHFINFKIIFALRFFKNVVAPKVFNFTFCYAVPCQASVDDIRHFDDRVKCVAVACIVSLWDYGSDGSLWVHLNAIINIQSRPFDSDIIITIYIPEVL